MRMSPSPLARHIGKTVGNGGKIIQGGVNHTSGHDSLHNSAFYLNLINTDTDMYVSGFLWNIPLVAHTVASMDKYAPAAFTADIAIYMAQVSVNSHFPLSDKIFIY